MSTIVICMAGLNTRFHGVGFDVPKYLLPLNDGTLLRLILGKLLSIESNANIFLLANIRDLYFKPHVEAELDVLRGSYPNVTIHIQYITDTRGQAETAYLASQYCDSEGSFLVHNADTVLLGRDLMHIENLLSSTDIVVDVFNSSNPAYSFVKSDNNGYITDIVEKEAITKSASSGLYCFSSSLLYKQFYEKYLSDHTSHNEIYISNLIHYMLNSGLSAIEYSCIDCETIVLGSPKEYLDFAGLYGNN